MQKVLVWVPWEGYEASKEGDQEDNLHRQLLIAAVVFILGDHNWNESLKLKINFNSKVKSATWKERKVLK